MAKTNAHNFFFGINTRANKVACIIDPYQWLIDTVLAAGNQISVIVLNVIGDLVGP